MTFPSKIFSSFEETIMIEKNKRSHSHTLCRHKFIIISFLYKDSFIESQF